MLKRKLLLLTLLLLLISVGIVVAQSSANFTLHRTVLLSGGAAESTSYQVKSGIGQPATGLVNGANYQVSTGFFQPGSQHTVWLPMIVK